MALTNHLKKISIIVPVYNVAPYLKRCVDSLLAQDMPIDEYEILLIDDGSTDDSGQLADEFANKHSNIIAYHKPNGGASSARNYGLTKAQGEYIWFVDADDTIADNILQSFHLYCREKMLDFLSFPIEDCYSENKRILSNLTHKPYNNVVDSLDYIRECRVGYSPWCWWAKRNILIDNQIYFIEGITQEDFDFVLRLLEFCPRISAYNARGAAYFYHIGRPGSITTQQNKQRYLKTLSSFEVVIESLIKKYPKTNDKSSYAFYVQPYIHNLKLYVLLYLLVFPLSWQEKKQYLAKFKKFDIYQISPTKFLKTKTQIASWVCRFPFLYVPLLYLKTRWFDE